MLCGVSYINCSATLHTFTVPIPQLPVASIALTPKCSWQIDTFLVGVRTMSPVTALINVCKRNNSVPQNVHIRYILFLGADI